MATSTTNLEEAVTQAVEKENVQQEGQTQETQTTEATETGGGEETESEVSDESEVDELGLSALEQKQARELFANLKGPNAGLIVDALAKQAGYIKAPETKQEVKEQKKGIQEVLRDKLGPELAFLADKLGPALQEVLTEQLQEVVDSQTSDIRQNMQQAEVQRVQQQVDQGLAKIGGEYFKENKIPDNILGKMNTLFKEILPTPNMTTDRYLSTVFHAACGELGVTPVKKQVQAKVTQNRNNVPGRLRSSQSGGEPQIIQGSQKLNLTDSIQKAIDQLNK